MVCLSSRWPSHKVSHEHRIFEIKRGLKAGQDLSLSVWSLYSPLCLFSQKLLKDVGEKEKHCLKCLTQNILHFTTLKSGTSTPIIQLKKVSSETFKYAQTSTVDLNLHPFNSKASAFSNKLLYICVSQIPDYKRKGEIYNPGTEKHPYSLQYSQGDGYLLTLALQVGST